MHGNTLRSKTKVLPNAVAVGGAFPDWTFDGSSTGQSDTRDSDCILRPVFSCPDPIRGGNNLLVLCEVMNPDGTPHATNTRAQLRAVIDNKVTSEAPLFGWEQEYTMIGKNGCVADTKILPHEAPALTQPSHAAARLAGRTRASPRRRAPSTAAPALRRCTAGRWLRRTWTRA